jgi:hypothetical protein
MAQSSESESATSPAGPASRRAADPAAAAARRAGREAAAEATRQIGETLRGGTEAGAQAMRASVESVVEATRLSSEMVAEQHGKLLEQAADGYDAAGQTMVKAAQETAANLRAMMVAPNDAGGRIRSFHEGMAGLTNGLMQTSLRANQEYFRFIDPVAMFDLQRRIMSDYTDILMQGASSLLRTLQQTVEQTARPIEERLRDRARNLDQRHRETHGHPNWQEDKQRETQAT